MLHKIDLQETYELGKELISPRIAAINLQVSAADLIRELNNSESEVHVQYFSGYIETKKKHQQDVIKCKNTVDENRFIEQKIIEFETAILIQLDIDD